MQQNNQLEDNCVNDQYETASEENESTEIQMDIDYVIPKCLNELKTS